MMKILKCNPVGPLGIVGEWKDRGGKKKGVEEKRFCSFVNVQ